MQFALVCNASTSYILRKTIEGYQNSLDFFTFDKIIYNQSIFVFDRTTNGELRKMQN